MRNGDVLLFTVIITGIGKFRIIFTRKFPPYFESLLFTDLLLQKSKITNYFERRTQKSFRIHNYF